MKGSIIAVGLAAISAAVAVPVENEERGLPGWNVPSWPPIYQPPGYKPTPSPTKPSPPVHSIPHYGWKRNALAEPEAEAGLPGWPVPAWPTFPIPSYGPPKPTQSVTYKPYKRSAAVQPQSPEEIHQAMARGYLVNTEMVPQPNPVLEA